MNSVNGNTYAFSWYLDLVHEEWDALIEDDYKRVMPLTLSTKFGVTYFYQPYFTQQLGVFSIEVLNPQIIENFINSIPKHIKVVDVNFNNLNSIDDKKYEVLINNNYLLDLISDYSKISSKYSKNTKRNLKKGFNNNLTFLKGVKPELIIAMFRSNKGKDVGGWSDSNYHILRRLMYATIHKGMGFTCGVYSEHNELCAAAFFLKNANQIVFLFSGSNEIARSNGAMTFLIDSVIKSNAPGGKVLDFEGSNNENLARFYKGFGARKSTYSRLKIVRLNVFMKSFIKLYNAFK